ncbi:hypothetical protein ANCDUO_10109, partial [Ancylostoma duodenale]
LQWFRTYNPFMEEEDRLHPMFEQRDIIKGYLAQAATAGRLEEVEMLERNLKDLEGEMLKMEYEIYQVIHQDTFTDPAPRMQSAAVAFV